MSAWLDLRSFGRQGPGRRDRLTPNEVAQIARIVRGTPEVMVKVSGGSSSVSRAIAHMRYISRRGNLDLETDDGERYEGKDAAQRLTSDWQLGIDELLARDPYRGRAGRRSEKLTHHLVLSMPAGIPSGSVLEAARGFAREQFALQHRYALVLHTDQPHPHVHVAVRAMGENGKRLRIRKATLRQWRECFAEQLRAQGVAANATPAVVRGSRKRNLTAGRYRKMERGEISAASRSLESADHDRGSAVASRTSSSENSRSTRQRAREQWAHLAETLQAQGESRLAQEVSSYAGRAFHYRDLRGQSHRLDDILRARPRVSEVELPER